jgi:isopentenyl phosphate kinase
MAGKLTALKLGGSVITDKTKPCTPRLDVIEHLSAEIAEANIEPLIIVHGGGSFGHPTAKQYDLASGYKNKTQLTGFAKTRQNMMTLNKLIVDSLISHGVNAISIPPSASITTTNKTIAKIDITLIKKALNLKLTPVLHGDAVLDSKLGFTILSGDQLIKKLAILLNSEKIVLAVDVDGLYISDPKASANAKLIEKINLQQLKKLLKTFPETNMTTDVTGMMPAKIKEMIPAVERGIRVIIVNGQERNRVLQALRNEKFLGTIIQRK